MLMHKLSLSDKNQRSSRGYSVTLGRTSVVLALSLDQPLLRAQVKLIFISHSSILYDFGIFNYQCVTYRVKSGLKRGA